MSEHPTPTISAEAKKAQPKTPRPLFSCAICCEEYSWPADDIFWSETKAGWFCSECWDTDFGNVGPSVKDALTASDAAKDARIALLEDHLAGWRGGETACRAQLAQKDAEIAALLNMLRAVSCSEFDGFKFSDVNKKNWWDERDHLLSAATKPTV